MSDLQKYIEKRIVRDAEFAEDFEKGYASFKLGILLRQAREAAGLSQEDIAQQLGTPKSTVSKIENHAEEVRLSLLRQYAEALGKNLYVSLAWKLNSMLPKTQHYVPRFILENFCSNNTSQIYVFDKKQETVFRTHIKNVAAEKGFYNFEEDEATFSVEPALSNLESIAANLINQIIDKESLASITDAEKLLLSIFIAAQFARVKQMRVTIKQVNDDLIEKIKAMGYDPNNVDGFTPLDEIGVNKTTILGLRGSIEEYTPYIYDKAWMLFKTPKSTPNYISDNPVTLQNMNDFSPRGNLGLAVKGIEIYFPISRRLSLGIFCRSNAEMIRTGYEKYIVVKRAGLLKRVGVEKEKTDSLKRLKYGLETGHAVQSQVENVVNRNSLQVINSTRFVYSSSNEFDLVSEMLKADSKLKEAPRMIND